MPKDFHYLMTQFTKTNLQESHEEELKRYSVFPYLYGMTKRFDLWVKTKKSIQDNEPSES